MARANAAYYATHDPFADFTTAPEITQVFGEMLGAWAAVVVAGDGPARSGAAGRGRARARHADGGRAARDRARWRRLSAPRCALHLVETSPRLRAAQAERGCREARPGTTRSTTLPHGPLLLLANEFLDALPIRQFVRRGDGWARALRRRRRRSSRRRQPPAAGRARRLAEGAVIETLRGRRWPSPAQLARTASRQLRRRRAVPRLRPGRQRPRRQPAGAARRQARRSAGRPGHGRPDRACRFRGAGARRRAAGRRRAWPGAAGAVPRPARPVPAHRPAGADAAARRAPRR